MVFMVIFHLGCMHGLYGDISSYHPPCEVSDFEIEISKERWVKYQKLLCLIQLSFFFDFILRDDKV